MFKPRLVLLVVFILGSATMLLTALANAADYQWGMRTRYQSVNDT